MELKTKGELKEMLDQIEAINYENEKKELLSDTIQYMSGYLVYATKCNTDGITVGEEPPGNDRREDQEDDLVTGKYCR